MSKKIVSTAIGSNNHDESEQQQIKPLNHHGTNKKRSDLVASLYNYSKSDTKAKSSGSISDSAQKSAQLLTEADLLSKFAKQLPIRSADVLKLTRPCESKKKKILI